LDNISHTLVGLSLAELAFRGSSLRGKPSGSRFRRALCIISLAANNLPDLDFVYAPITEGKLGYLLHHRGHSHTLIGGVVLSALILLATWGWARWRKVDWQRNEWILMAAVAFGGTWLHVAMDFWNSYGVHPFWPFSNAWLYGDAVFIVEPWIWIALAPPLFLSSETLVGRIFCGLVLTLAIGLSWITGYVPLPIVGCMILVGAFLFWKKEGLELGLGLAGMLILSQFFISKNVSARLSQTMNSVEMKDIILTPMPANPLCWMFVTVGTEPDSDTYILRRGIVSAFPGWMESRFCPQFRMHPGTANLTPLGEFRGSRSQLRTLASERCPVDAFLRFARAPFYRDYEGGLVVGDLRFDREESLGFGEMFLRKSDRDCPRWVPPWAKPRADLID
jgi:inner membrane protein